MNYQDYDTVLIGQIAGRAMSETHTMSWVSTIHWDRMDRS